MGKKNTGKARHAAPARKPREKRTGVPFAEDPPPQMSAQQLADKFNVSHDTIRDYAKLPHAPVQTRPGKWMVVEWERFWALVMEHGGPRGWKKFVEESELPAGAIPPGKRGTVAGAAAMSEGAQAEADAAANATTAQELNRLKTEHLAKAKLAEEVLTRRLANQERKRRLVPRAAVEEVIYSRAQAMKAEAKKITLELPPKLIGLERPEIEERLGKAFEQFFSLISAFGSQIGAPAPGPAEPATATTARAADEERGQPGEARGGGVGDEPAPDGAAPV